MTINIKSQKDSLLTEVTLDAEADLNELDALMRASKSTGKILAVYNQGGRLQVSVDQKTRVAEKVSEDVRQLIGVSSKEIAPV